MAKAADRSTYAEWVAGGKQTAMDYAKERVAQILASHEPEPLLPGQERDLERILEDARSFYRRRGQL